MRRAAWLAGVCFTAMAVGVWAQQPQSPPPPQQPTPKLTPTPQPPPSQVPGQQAPVFRAGANLVRVDVTVLDKRGTPLADLKPDDFEITEDNIPQKVATLKFVRASGAAPDDDVSLEIRSPEHAAVEAARDDVRVFVIFWDEYHIGQMIPAIRARQTLTSFVETAFAPTDLVALMDQLTPTDAIRFTRNFQDVAQDVRDLKGRQGVYIPPRSVMEEAQLSRGGSVEVLRSQVTASALEATIAYLGEIKEGRKSILLVSSTIGRLSPDSPSDTYDWLAKVIRSANANNVSIYVLDPRGLDINTRTSDVLLSLAENTGGRIFNNNFPAAALHDMVKNASAFYLLGYASTQNPVDGKFHQIRVKVKRPGVEVKARSGYFAPSLAMMDTARAEAAKNETPPEISRALGSIVEAPHVASAGDLWAGVGRGPNGAPHVTVAWTPRPGATTPMTLHVTTDKGEVLFDGPLTANRADFDAAPGVLHLRRNLLDVDGGVDDKVETTLEVPDFERLPLALTTPVIYRATTPAELRAIQADANPAPYAGRQFERTDRLFIRVTALGNAAAGATVTATLLGSHGAKLAELPIAAKDGGYQIDLPMASVARGEYVIAIEAVSGSATAKALVPIRVVAS